MKRTMVYKGCRNCGKPIKVQIFKGKKYCSDDCRKALLSAEDSAAENAASRRVGS